MSKNKRFDDFDEDDFENDSYRRNDRQKDKRNLRRDAEEQARFTRQSAETLDNKKRK